MSGDRLSSPRLVTRALACGLCVVLMGAFAGVGAPLAAAASFGAPSPLTEGASEPETTTPTTASSSTETSNGKSTSVIVIALAAAALLLGAIVFVIVRDVRRVAPATDAEMAQRSSAGDPAVALRRRRARAKAARAQRKRNR